MQWSWCGSDHSRAIVTNQFTEWLYDIEPQTQVGTRLELFEAIHQEFTPDPRNNSSLLFTLA
jgi:hypothetical protein